MTKRLTTNDSRGSFVVSRMVKLLDGRALAEKKLAKLKKEIVRLHAKPCLAAILVGDDPSSVLYVSIKEKKARELGIPMKTIFLSPDTSQEGLEKEIKKLNLNADIQGILLQLPLPKHLAVDEAVALIEPSKDVDGFHPASGVISPLILAIRDLLKSTGVRLGGKRAKLFIKSKALYEAVKQALAKEGIAIIDDSLNADIIVTAIGKSAFLKSSMIKEGAIVIDAGITREGRTIRGDAAPEVVRKAGYVSPVPGGVGPLTVANLFSNLIELTRRFLAREGKV